MKTFNSLEEMRPYYNANTGTYDFFENGERIDICINFFLDIEEDIIANKIIARQIQVNDIYANDVRVLYIDACDIHANNIYASKINANDIYANDIDANDIITQNIDAKNLRAFNIYAQNIKSYMIDFSIVCLAHKKIICKTINGKRENSRYFCLDSDVVINKKED